MSRIALSLGLTVVTAGCFFGGAGQGKERIPAAKEGVLITVDNQNFLDVRVYWVRAGGVERRLGVVNGHGAGQFPIPWDPGDLQVRFDFIGGGGLITQRLRVQPGSILELRIDAQGRYYVLRH